MSSNAEIIAALEKAKATLQDQTDSANESTLNRLTATIHNLSWEIGAIEAKALDATDYVPTTDPFRSQTNNAKAFLATLDELKKAFAAAGNVAAALDMIIQIISKFGL